MKRVIVTADDFGRSSQINRAVIRAHRQGILTCASLMVSGRAAAEAVQLAKANPSLKVGLHLVLVDGYAVLSRKKIPDLVNSRGRFAEQPAAAGVRYFFSSRARKQVRQECRAQIEAFLGSGLKMDHLNSHHHLHIHPTIAGILVDLAKPYGIPAIRLPFQGLRTVTKQSAGMAAVMLPWVFYLKLRLTAAGIAHNREILGLYETGAMSEASWLRLIPQLKPGVTEIFCHPAADAAATDNDTYGQSEEEYKALLSPKVKERLRREKAVLTGFSR